MSESTASTTGTQPKAPSFWEDLIDIFFQPAAVFRRRADKSVWPPMLFVAISVAIIVYATFNTIEPAYDAEFARRMAKAAAKNPQMTAELMDKMRAGSNAAAKYGIGVIMLISMFVTGSFAWLIGKLVSSRQSYHAALVVAAWAYVPRVIGIVFNGVQGLLLDPSKLTGVMSLTLSPARLFDPETTNPFLYQMAGRLDLFIVWETVLLAIGLYVTGKVSKERAIVFGILIWLLGSLPVLQSAYTSM